MRFLATFWLGLLVGVSFLATPIKFRAETLTLPAALDVGRATFHAFTRAEWLLASLLIVFAVMKRAELDLPLWSAVAVVLAIVVVQSGYLLPRLDVRVAAIIGGEELPSSPLHQVYIATEVLKAVVLLLAAGPLTAELR